MRARVSSPGLIVNEKQDKKQTKMINWLRGVCASNPAFRRWISHASIANLPGLLSSRSVRGSTSINREDGTGRTMAEPILWFLHACVHVYICTVHTEKSLSIGHHPSLAHTHLSSPSLNYPYSDKHYYFLLLYIRRLACKSPILSI